MRDTLAELIGVQATELGCDIKETRIDGSARCQSILIFDRFAAGYASSADRYLTSLFRLARNRLDCPASCDSACPHCVLDFDQRFAVDNLNRWAALDVLTDAWLNSMVLPNEYAFFGAGSRQEYRRLPEVIWQAVSRQNAEGIRFYTGGDTGTWDIGPSPLRELIYRLAGHGIQVDVITTRDIIEGLDDVDRYLLASLADHTKVTIHAVDKPTRCGSGWLVAETMMDTVATRWALPAESGLAFNLDWGQFEGPLIAADFSATTPSPGEVVHSDLIRPHRNEASDRELEIHHELDGSLQGFGIRFWHHITEHHHATQVLFRDESHEVTSLTYHDRYLFTPLSVALLLEVVTGLREMISRSRWSVEGINISTTSRRTTGDNKSRNTVWSDWPDSIVRDRVLVEAFNYVGIETALQLAEGSGTSHGRLLEVEWSSGRKLTVRLDQGISYWRAAHSNGRQFCNFDLYGGDFERQAELLANLVLAIEGAHLPTQLFIKVR